MMDEEQAIARLKQGDLEGLDVLVLRYQVQAVQCAYLIVRDRPLAEDLTQAAFLRAYEKIAQFDQRRPFGPWFLRSVIHAAIKAAKREKKQVALDVGGDDGSPGLEERMHAPEPEPEQRLENKETCQAVWQALGRLEPKHRAVVIMKYFLEMGDAEVAQFLKLPLTTVKWWLHTSRQKLQTLLRSTWMEDQGED